MEWKKRQKAEHDNVMLLAMSTLPPKLKINTYQKNEDGRKLYFKSLSQMEPHTKYVLYMLADGKLYRTELGEEEQTVLAEGLTEDQYALSEDGSRIAYQVPAGEDDGNAGIQVLDLQSGEGYTVEAADGENVRPLGFVNSDFVYGKSRAEDAGTSPALSHTAARCPMPYT